ncbi:MAG TPA: TlpA family protein disulfide reductase [Capillimicrobium sp.]|nr:TlpA family protein disulfide reductase [Capillimicrobium sp.]
MPGGVLLAIRLVLGATFAVAGAAKLADRKGSREALRGFGVPDGAVAPLAVALPLAELAIAAALLPARTATVAAACALVLLLAFVAAIARAVRRGEAPDCHCFGQLHSEPAGGRTLARNGVLAALAVVVVAAGAGDPGPSAVAWLGDLSGAAAVAVAAGAFAAVLLVGGGAALMAALRAHGRLLLRVEDLERQLAAIRSGELAAYDDAGEDDPGSLAGQRAPSFALPAAAGGVVGLEDLLRPALPALLVFSDPSCGPCRDLMPDVAAWQAGDADRVVVAVLATGDAEAVRAEAAGHELDRVLLDGDRAVAGSFEAHGTPAAVLVSADGTIAAGPAYGPEGVRGLHDRALAGLLDIVHVEPGPRVGDAVPHVVLPALDGATVDLSEPRGVPSVVLFWNPGCGFCRDLREDLRAWEQRRAPGDPELIVLSAGAEATVRDEGFSGVVLLDDDFTAGDAFGASGTPMAVLIDAEARIASETVAGADEVLALLRAGDPAGARWP